ncbi:flavin reductase family protein [Endozoicomonas gorgoniicola]|uniref:Flavin reductase family protein n=1 Tax=Endozoicomonas gorgoniicola TaxID=1234144 RepID=A0ABT3MZD3_9GAMM|nr:flavin reductase family protein [Endozoicomonas gorgoniicola]MCW7554727.1 flavin reductase family protein [Endozoicomonas gorgoniicola]
MHIDPTATPVKDVYKLLISTVTPRPIAWVSSIDDQGIVNLAPFSFFNVVSVNPPVLGFSPLLDGTGKSKDTLNNIRNTGEFVVNVVSHHIADAMNQTSAPYEHHIDELQQAGLTAMPSSLVKPPSVKEAMVHYECRLHDLISFGNDPLAGNLILGQICHIHVNDELKDGDRINVSKLDTVGRMEGSYYSTTRDRFAIDRPILD